MQSALISTRWLATFDSTFKANILIDSSTVSFYREVDCCNVSSTTFVRSVFAGLVYIKFNTKLIWDLF